MIPWSNPGHRRLSLIPKKKPWWGWEERSLAERSWSHSRSPLSPGLSSLLCSFLQSSWSSRCLFLFLLSVKFLFMLLFMLSFTFLFLFFLTMSIPLSLCLALLSFLLLSFSCLIIPWALLAFCTLGEFLFLGLLLLPFHHLFAFLGSLCVACSDNLNRKNIRTIISKRTLRSRMQVCKTDSTQRWQWVVIRAVTQLFTVETTLRRTSGYIVSFCSTFVARLWLGRVPDADKLSCNESLTRDRIVNYHLRGSSAIINFLSDPVAMKEINSAIDTPSPR